MVENVWEELDNGGEYFFNESTSMLYLIPNTTYMQRIYVSSCFLLLLEQLLGLGAGRGAFRTRRPSRRRTSLCRCCSSSSPRPARSPARWRG